MKPLKLDPHALEKRNRILDAAIKVFARKGFHGCRVGDVAREAGIAYGLVYHYFDSKNELLNTIFIEKWGVFLEMLKNIDEQEKSLDEKLYAIASLLLDAAFALPDLMEVLVLEITRGQKFLEEKNLDALKQAFIRLEGIFVQARKAGDIRKDTDPKLLSYSFFGIVESLLTGYVLNTLDVPNRVQLENIKREIVNNFVNGIAVT